MLVGVKLYFRSKLVWGCIFNIFGSKTSVGQIMVGDQPTLVHQPASGTQSQVPLVKSALEETLNTLLDRLLPQINQGRSQTGLNIE